jgi:hypothetical protein
LFFPSDKKNIDSTRENSTLGTFGQSLMKNDKNSAIKVKNELKIGPKSPNEILASPSKLQKNDPKSSSNKPEKKEKSENKHRFSITSKRKNKKMRFISYQALQGSLEF